MIATCAGIRSAAIRGGRAPSGCGGGVLGCRLRGARGRRGAPGHGRRGRRGRDGQGRQAPCEPGAETGGGEDAYAGREGRARGALQQGGAGRVDGVELGTQQAGRRVEHRGGARVHASRQRGPGHPAAGQVGHGADQGCRGRAPASLPESVLRAGAGVQGLARQEETALGEVGAEVGEDVGELGTVDEPPVVVLPVQPRRHRRPGLLEQMADLVDPGRDLLGAPGPPLRPVGEVPAAGVVPGGGHGAAQPRQVQPPSQGGVHQRVPDRVRARAGRQVAPERLRPGRDAGGTPGRVRVRPVGQVVHGVRGRPQGPSGRTEHGRHQLDEGVDRGVVPPCGAPAQPVGGPQGRVLTGAGPRGEPAPARSRGRVAVCRGGL